MIFIDELDSIGRLFTTETLDEDEAYAAAGVPRASAPGALARGDVPGVPPEPGMPPRRRSGGQPKVNT
jgi:cell division protease FtsH